MFFKIFPWKKQPANPAETIDTNVLAQGLEQIKINQDKACKILDILKIPYSQSSYPEGPTVSGTALVSILMNSTKCNILFKMLRNKAFW